MRLRASRTRRMLALAASGVATLLGVPADAGQTGSMVTISLSGSTAMRNFTTAPGFSLLDPGSSITLGPIGSTVTYTATWDHDSDPLTPNVNTTSFQLAPTNGVTGHVTTGTDQVHPALRIEWHEQGSVEGILELADSQIDESLFDNVTYNPNAATATFVNRTKFGGTAPTTPLNPPASATNNNYTLAIFANSTDRTTAQIQNRVQMAISDVNAAQGFSRGGASGAFGRTPGQAGYGKGNPALAAAANTSGIGNANARQQLLDESGLNMATSKIDPGTGANYTAGPWNSAGVGNLHNETVAITATTLAANPGTGLVRINRTDAQWLQAAGRLGNGADFNVVTRDVNSGTRNVAALNVGLDPSFAVGENDAGTGGGATEDGLGAGIKFSNKSSGGSNLRPTVQNSRMGFGHLSISDYRNTGGGANNGNRPLRALDYRDDDNDLADAAGDPAVATTSETFGARTYDTSRGGFTPVNARTINSGAYALYQNQTYVTVKRPDAAFAGDTVQAWTARTDNPTTGTGIKGDNSGNDVYDVRNNIQNSVANFPATSIANPADAMLANAFILPQLMEARKDRDGVRQSVPNPNVNAGLANTFLGSSLAGNFDTTNPATVTRGTGVPTYGANPAGQVDAIDITDNAAGAGGNWLFGNFNQNDIRDFSAVKAAQAAQAALFASPHGVSMFSGASNDSPVAGLSPALAAMTGHDGTAGAKKGDLIVMGDYDSDGDFDGKDVYLLARGAALSDSTATETLTAASGADFGDMVRKGVLRKNAALDFMQTNATAQQKLDARADAVNDPLGANAFNKFDVNRDGLVNRKDAQLVDHFVGKDYRLLQDQLDAVVSVENGTVADGKDITGATVVETPRSISLVDVELTDSGTITHINSGGSSDFQLLRNALAAAKLLDGDGDFDGDVDFVDLGNLLNNYNTSGRKWSQGDFIGFDGVVGFTDLGALLNNYNQGVPLSAILADPASFGLSSSQASILASAVPEPGVMGVLSGAGLLALRRRRSRA